MRGGVGKYVLREAVKPWLPERTPKGRKLGFQMPLAEWFAGGFSDFAFEAWNSSGAADAGYLDRAEVASCSRSIVEDKPTTAGSSMRSRCLAAGGMTSGISGRRAVRPAGRALHRQSHKCPVA